MVPWYIITVPDKASYFYVHEHCFVEIFTLSSGASFGNSLKFHPEPSTKIADRAMAKTRKRRTSDNTDQNTKSKSQKLNGGKPAIKQGTLCSVCDKTIVEQSSDHDGDEAIFCEKRCGWLHRHCAGLTGPFFKLFTKNANTPFLCIYCMLKSQSDEICSLKATVQELENTMIALQKSIEIPSDSNNSSAAASTVATSLSASRLSSNPAPLQTVISSNPNQGHNSDPVHRTHPESDRKFNMIIHGVPESKAGTLKLARIQSDFNSVSSIVSGLNSGTHESSLRDCFRLGKYKKDSQQSRPILAKFNRPTDVLDCNTFVCLLAGITRQSPSKIRLSAMHKFSRTFQ